MDFNMIKRARTNILLSTVLFALFDVSTVDAKVTCYNDTIGNRYCWGIDAYGNYIDTSSYINFYGNVQTSGTIGDHNIDIETEMNSFNDVKISGTIDDDYVELETDYLNSLEYDFY